MLYIFPTLSKLILKRNTTIITQFCRRYTFHVILSSKEISILQNLFTWISEELPFHLQLEMRNLKYNGMLKDKYLEKNLTILQMSSICF